MKLYINEKNSWGAEKLEILDEGGSVCYTAQGESINTRNIVRIFDSDKEEIGVVKKNVLGLISSFDVEIYNELFGKIHPVVGIFRTKFDVNLFGWKVKGNWWGNRYKVYKDNKVIASFDYTLNGANANYAVDILNEEDKFPMILLVLTMYTVNAYKCSKRVVAQ